LVKDAKLGLVLLLSTWILVFFTSSPTSDAKGKMYESKNNKIYGTTKNYTRQQKIQQGLIIQDKMTLCRLKKRVKTKSGEEVCIYEGGNKTFEMAIEKSCPRSYQCKYNPHGEEPSIDSVVDSLNDAMK
jgi:hypothetical protein|tara:strand:+ start:516 stop:902 length:387 start_codon:yes stop_codon:yes gene_type:complete